jgi:pimeloyl-ACP methyl ester carboxylesterase
MPGRRKARELNTVPDLRTRVATSADGTAVEYLSAGRGPAVIVIPRVLATASDLAAFAMLLAERYYTVHVVQRRGRGGSGPQGERYGIARECEDIEAVRARTGAWLIFGHSFGGLVALRAACGSAAFDAVAAYEPGISVSGSMPLGWTGRARREMSAGADLEALTTFARGISPGQTGRVPRWLQRVILRHAVPRAELRQNLALLPQALNEYTEAGRLDARFPDYREITAATLMMHGRRGTRHAAAVAWLAETIPRSETMTFPGLGHAAPEKKPGQIADTVLRFFAAHAKPGSGSRVSNRV